MTTDGQRIEIDRRSGVAQVSTGDPAFLADLSEDGPRHPGGATVAQVLVRFTELTALVLPMW